MTTRSSGTIVRASASVESRMRTWSKGSDGSSAGREPVAITASWNCKCSTWSSASTATRSRPTKRAVPGTISTPRSSVPTPSRRRSTTPPVHFCAAPRSTSTPPTSPVPVVTRCRAWSRSWASEISAFDGMHPTLRQVPPSCADSTRTTCRPSSTARAAAVYPPGPPPSTSTSTGRAISPATIRRSPPEERRRAGSTAPRAGGGSPIRS
jgi:hypothetical protein